MHVLCLSDKSTTKCCPFETNYHLYTGIERLKSYARTRKMIMHLFIFCLLWLLLFLIVLKNDAINYVFKKKYYLNILHIDKMIVITFLLNHYIKL